MKGCMTVVGTLFSLFVGFIILCVMVGASSRPSTGLGSSTASLPGAAVPAGDSTLHLAAISRWSVGAFGMVEIHGTAINNSGHDLSYAQISFRLLDKEGAQVGTALANVANLSSGSRWRFTASGVGEGAVRLETGEITAF